MNFNKNLTTNKAVSQMTTEEIANKIFCDDIKPPKSIQLIYPDANVKEIFEQLMVIFTIGMKIYHGDDYGNVDLSKVSDNQFKRIIQYFASFGIRLICEIKKNSVTIDESNNLPPVESKNNNLNDYFLRLKTKYLIYIVSFDFI